jgi:glycosyltransferase involved in cell wall biosynthesis
MISREPAHVHWVERPALRAHVERAIDQHRPDVLYLFGWGTAQLWRAAHGVPTVHCAVDPWAGSTTNRLLPWWRRIAGAEQVAKVRAHEERHYPRVGLVTVVAPEDAAEIRQRIPDARVRVVRNGVHAGPVPHAEGDDGVIGFHGAFVVRSNTVAARALVRDVLPRVRARAPGARVLLVGREPPEEIRGLESAEVTIMADVAQVRPWLERMAVYVAPMTVGTGLKNKVLEAMAAGRPVVATPLALQGIGPGPGVIEAPDLGAVADEAARLLVDPDERSRLGHEARARVVREFSWERSAEQLEGTWREVISGSAGLTKTPQMDL